MAASFLPEGSVGTAQIRDQAVTNSRIGNDAVGTKKIRDGAVTTKQIKDGTIRAVDLNWTLWQDLQSVVGHQGDAGPTGAQGVAGTSGAQGVAGAMGPTGPQGPAGPQGAVGPTGPADGTAVLNGAANPTAGIGQDGDFYINTTTNQIWGPKASGAWPASGVSLVGPTGGTGPTGPQGPSGGSFAPEYGQWSSTQTQGGAAFTSQDTVVPITFNTEDITPTSGISLEAAPRNWSWRFTTAGTWAGGFSAQIRKSGNGTATVGIWWQYASPSSGCDQDSDFTNAPNSATRVRLASAGDQSTMTVLFVFPVPEGGMCGRLVANSESAAPAEITEMEIYYDAARGTTRPVAPSVIANVWRVG